MKEDYTQEEIEYIEFVKKEDLLTDPNLVIA